MANVDVRMQDPGSLSNLPPNADEPERSRTISSHGFLPPPFEDVVEAASTPLQTHGSSSPDISTVALESDASNVSLSPP